MTDCQLVQTQHSEANLESDKVIQWPRRTRITSACLRCKARRRKCNGDVPCQTCKKLSIMCFYDPTQDRRSRSKRQRKALEETAEPLQPRSQAPLWDCHLTQQQSKDFGFEISYRINTCSEVSDDFGRNSTEGMDWPPDVFEDGTPSGVAAHTPPLTPSGSLPSQTLVCTSLCNLLTRTACVTWYPAHKQFQQLTALLRQTPHTIPVHHIPDVSPLSLAYTSFMSTAAHQLQLGLPLSFIIGDIDPDIDRFVHGSNPLDSLHDTTPALTVSTWASELVKQYFPFDIYTQLGYILLLCRFMRWALSPTLENWTLLPPIMRPTDLQRQVAHYASADMQPLPVIRDALIRGRRILDKPIGDVKRAGTDCINMFWPFGMEDAIERNALTGQMVLSRLFVAVASEESSWSCGGNLLKEISGGREDIYYVIEHDHGWEGGVVSSTEHANGCV